MAPFLAALAVLAPLQVEVQAPRWSYPPVTPIEAGLSPDAVAGLGDLVQGLVDSGEIVGGELLVIKDGRTVLHGAYGFRDVEGDVRMEPGGVFCVRSMTKPLIGAAVAMLVEEKKIKLSDPIAKYLPSFDADSTRAITIEQLVQHRSGLSMSQIMVTDPRKLTSIRAVADLGGGSELEFKPGTGFNYSDQGTDTLTALIEIVTGGPAEDVIAERILRPLGMGDTTCLMSDGHPLRERAASAYSGAPGEWTRFWGPDESALFPIFLGSQGLYSTAVDYAKFLDMWMRRGKGPDGRLLRSSSVRRSLKATSPPDVAGTGFPGLSLRYGSLMQLWLDGEEDVVAFGHTGSDGTHAWAFPKERAMVLYFTQSRGTTTGLQVEEKLGELILGAKFNPIDAAPPLEQHVGYYCEDTVGDRYRAIVLHGEGIALEILGKAVVPLIYAGGDRWKLKVSPGTILEFDRSETGEVTGYHIGDHYEYRFDPDPSLPTSDDVAAHISATHRVGRLESVGALLMKSEVTIPKLKVSGTRSAWYAAPDLWRVDEVTAGESAATAFDGEALRMQSGGKPAEVMGPEYAATLADAGLANRFGDWRKRGVKAQVIQRIAQDGRSILLVRLGDLSAAATTLYIVEEDWVVRRLDGMTQLPGVGKIGQTIEFEDFREVDGMLLPFRIELALANPMIGKITAVVTEAKTIDAPPVGHFRLEGR